MTPMEMYAATSQPQLIHIMMLGAIALTLLLSKF